MSGVKGIRRDRLKLRFTRPEGEISRRELLKMIVPRYEVIPYVEPELCRRGRKCRLCLKSCPLKAISINAQGDKATVDTALCSGCGACVAACPHRAVIYPTFSHEKLDEEMGALTDYERWVIVFTCQGCLPAGDEATELTNPSGIVRLKVPCLATVSPWLMLRAFDRGAGGLAMFYRPEKCPVKSASNRWQHDIRFVRELLNYWDIGPERIELIEIAGDSGNVTRQLEQFAQEIASLGPTPLHGAEPAPVPGEGWLLPALIKALGDKTGTTPKGTVATGTAPFGRLELDARGCTGCGLCALYCPTGALAASSGEETGKYQLLFRHDRCVACGRCIEACPGDCLDLERALEPEKLDGQAAILFEDMVIRCRQCGSVIGSAAMIERLRAELREMGDPLTTQLEFCSTCKARNFSLGRAVPGTGRDKDDGDDS